MSAPAANESAAYPPASGPAALPLREAQTRLSAILQAVPDLLFMLDGEGRVVDYRAPHPENLYISDTQRFIGQKVVDMLPEPAAGVVRRAIAEAIAKGYHRGAVYSLPMPDGEEWYELSIAVQGNLQTNEGRLVAIVRNVTAQKKAEDTLRESRTLLAQAEEIAEMGSWELDLAGNRLRWSDEVYRIFGLAPERFGATYDAFLEQVHPADRAAVEAAFAASLRAGQESYEIVHRIVRPAGGEIRWVREKCFHDRDRQGQVVRSRGMVMDVTAQKEAEDALRQSETKYQTLIANMPDAIAITGLDGRLVEWNPAFEALLGYSAAELRHKHYSQFTPARWRRSDAAAMRQVRMHGYSTATEKEYRRKDGTRVPIEIRGTLIRDEAGQPAGIWAVIRDVTARKQAELALRDANDRLEERVAKRTAELEASRQELAQSEEQFRQMAQNIRDGFWLADAKTRKVLYVNPAFTRIWNRPIGKLDHLASRWMAAVHPEDREQIRRVFQTQSPPGASGTISFRLRWPDGTFRWIEASTARIRTGRGGSDRAVGVLRDVTDHRRLEESILNAGEAERQRIGRDLHDGLGQSLTAIRYMVEAVHADCARAKRPEAAELGKIARLIEETAQAAHALSHSLLPLDLKRQGLGTALRELAMDVRRLFKVPCRYAGADDVDLNDVNAASQLYRIAQEAATNAAKHSRAKEIEIRLARKPNGLLLSVRDTGCGIPPKRGQAAGMGLDIMRYRAGMIGAALGIDSVRGRGTVVNCLLPLPAAQEVVP